MKKRIKFCLMIAVCIVLVILFPILMDIFILGNDIPSNISNSDWAGFIGSYVGGIATIVAVVITIWHTTKENNERMIQAGLENRENRRKFIKPFLETRCSYINEPTNMKENDRIFIFKDKMCCRVRSNFEQNDIDAMNTLNVPYMFCYKIINAGAEMPQGVYDVNPTYTINNTNTNYTNPILLIYTEDAMDGMDEMDEYQAYSEIVRENIDMDSLMQRYPYEQKGLCDGKMQLDTKIGSQIAK